jgi:hypothetical protein
MSRPVKQTFNGLEQDRNGLEVLLKRAQGNVERPADLREEILSLGYRLYEIYNREVLRGRVAQAPALPPKTKGRRKAA